MSKDLRAYATKAATPTMEAFADFLIAEVYGGTLPDGLDVESFRKGVALGGSTRMDFQRSDAWKNDPRNYLANVDARKAEKAAEALRKAEEAKARTDARIAKARATLAALEAATAAANGAEDGAEDVEPANGVEDGVEARIVSSDELEADNEERATRRSRRGRNAA